MIKCRECNNENHETLQIEQNAVRMFQVLANQNDHIVVKRTPLDTISDGPLWVFCKECEAETPIPTTDSIAWQ